MAFRRHRRFLAAALLPPLCALAACATIDMSQKPPSDWPMLHMEILQNVPKLVKAYCPGFGVFGCTVSEFDGVRCLVMMTTYSQRDLDIELSHKHCMGYDHVGETTMRDAWSDYKKSNRVYRAEREIEHLAK